MVDTEAKGETITLGKMLNDISPVPTVSQVEAVRANARCLATLLNTKESIAVSKEKKKKNLKGKGPAKKRLEDKQRLAQRREM